MRSVPVCRRCAALVGGFALGSVVGLLSLPSPVFALLAVPAVADAVAEKLFGFAHRAGRLLVTNAVLGAVAGAALVVLGRSLGVLAYAAVLGAAKVATSAVAWMRRRRRPPVAPTRGSGEVTA